MRVVSWLASVSLLLLVASGCGNVESGAGAPGDEAPGADDDDDDGATPSATPTPGDETPGNGAPPDALGGWFSIGNIRSQGNDPPAGLGGSGFFSSQAIPLFLAEPWEALFGGYPDMALDSCGWGWGASIAIAGDQVSIPAGELALSTAAGSGDFFLLPLGGLQLYIANAMPSVFMPAGESYTLTGSGDQVGAFSTTFQGPPDVHVTQPSNLTTAVGPIGIDKNQDYPLKWESANDGLPLFVFLLQAESEDAAPQVVVCKFENDGEGTIPASAFQLLPEAGWGSTASLQILKYRLHTFTPPGATGPVLVNFASGYDIEVAYQ